MKGFHMSTNDDVVDPKDLPIWGGTAIAKQLKLINKRGQPDRMAAYYKLERGYIDADKVGNTWMSTPRRLLKLPR
jgi:hypothetical protein